MQILGLLDKGIFKNRYRRNLKDYLLIGVKEKESPPTNRTESPILAGVCVAGGEQVETLGFLNLGIQKPEGSAVSL